MDIDPVDGRVSFQLKAGVLFRGCYSEIVAELSPILPKWIKVN